MRNLLGAVGALLIAASCRAALPQADVKVLTFNILTGVQFHIGYQGINAIPMWNNRRGDVVKIIRGSGADLIGLQETTEIDLLLPMISVHQYKDLSAALEDDGEGEYVSVYQEHSFGATPYAAARYDALIFYRRSRFDLLDRGSFALSETPAVAYSVTKSWGNAVPRLVLYAHLRDKATGKTFYFLTTHVDNDLTAKENSLALIRDYLPQILPLSDEPAIFCGDFNVDWNTGLMPQLLGDAWEDSFAAVAKTQAEVPHSYGTELIDHVLYSKAHPMAVKSWAVLPNRANPNPEDLTPPVSDHNPVFAELAF